MVERSVNNMNVDDQICVKKYSKAWIFSEDKNKPGMFASC